MPLKNTIIYVDDDPDDRDILAELFASESGYSFLPLPSGQDLFQVLPSVYMDTCLIILDINMPVDNGVDVLKKIRRHQTYQSLPAIMLTTGANSPQSSQAEQMGVTVEAKPATMQDMQALKERLLTYCHG